MSIFKDIEHGVSQGSKAVEHVFSEPAKKIEGAVGTLYHDTKGAVSDVYHDARSAAKYGGKHLINDVDTISNTIANPMLWIAVGAVVLIALNSRR